MPSQSGPGRRADHTTVFPPANNQAIKLEARAAASSKTKPATASADAQASRSREIEDQEAERWDGMS